MRTFRLPYDVIRKNALYETKLHEADIVIAEAQLAKERLIGQLRLWIADLEEEYKFVVGRDEVDMKTGMVTVHDDDPGESDPGSNGKVGTGETIQEVA